MRSAIAVERSAWLGLCLFGLAATGVAGAQPRGAGRPAPLAGVARVFEANQGQTDPAVRFLSRGEGYSLFLTASELVFAFANTQPTEVVRLAFVGAGRSDELTGRDPQLGHVNYIGGRDPSRWTRRAPTYARVRRGNLYPGIDAVFYARGRTLEFDLEIAPGVDPGVIALSVEGARRVAIDEGGDLVLALAGGELRLPKPAVFQAHDGQVQAVEGGYRLIDERTVAVVVGSYDRTRPLVVDPALVYSTYLGGTDQDYAADLAVDSSGSLYLVGTTTSVDFPTASAFRAEMRGSYGDAFVVKLDPSGTQIVYSTYFGGSSLDSGESIAVDAAGCAYITGHTQSADFPLVNALGSSFNGLQAGFVAKLDPTGSDVRFSSYFGTGLVMDVAVDEDENIFIVATGWPGTIPTLNRLFWGGPHLAKIHPSGRALLYSTGLGGTSGGRADTVALAPDGNPVVGGYTYSTDFPVLNAIQDHYGGGLVDGFVSKVSSTPQPQVLLAATFDEENGGNPVPAYAGFAGFAVRSGSVDLVVDPTGGLSVVAPAGVASTVESVAELELSPNLWIYPEANRSVYRLQVGLIGGAGSGSGRVTVRLADVFSETFVVAAGAAPLTVSREIVVADPTNGRLAIDWTADGAQPLVSQVTLEKLEEAPALVFSTYLGGGGNDGVGGVAVSPAGLISIAGSTTSQDFPIVNAFQPANGGGQDGFVAQMSGSGSTLLASSYLGGAGDEEAFAVAVDSAGHTLVGGVTGSADMPVRLPLQDGYGGATDGFVAQFRPGGEAILSSYLGGSDYDAVYGILADPTGAIYVTGQTSSVDFPIASAFQPANAGGNDAFLTKISLDTTPPDVECGGPDGLWHGVDVVISCSAADTGSGLASPSDASFTLTTSVPADTETASAATGTRLVCDSSGSCATAGPVEPNMVDRRPPTVDIGSPSAGTYTLNEPVTAEYSCVDAGSGVASCAGSVPAGAVAETDAVGTHVLSVVSRDAVGNPRSESVTYLVAFAVCLDYDPAKAHRSGSTLPIKLRLCDASATNVSSPSIQLIATGLFRVSTSASGPVEDSGNANPDMNFRHTGDSGPNAGYVFNLSLKGLAEGTYELRFVASGDPTTHSTRFQVR